MLSLICYVVRQSHTINNSLPVYRQYSLISYPQFSNSYPQSYPQVLLVMNTCNIDNVNVVITKLNECSY